MTNPTALSTFSAQIVVSKYCFLPKGLLEEING